ncbi:hypothetical protein BUALT_Bualt07G0082200 [Buddleja alternifolia]|uniref:Uncharacterized protein n=1 Tax=Buddleja alternifolia TaxID=168488 RepID=A0AAV6X8D7_9LAMI|nr:hypothetical protein BUALT_Bualt07G0082200 [Buddleja alternifolia]
MGDNDEDNSTRQNAMSTSQCGYRLDIGKLFMKTLPPDMDFDEILIRFIQEGVVAAICEHRFQVVFFPLWLFHVVVARGRFSLPAPSVPHDRHWAPCHAVVAMPLLVAFELLLCIHLESLYVTGSAAVNLKIVFLPLLAFEVIILIDNFRMCKALLPGDDESMSDEAVWETLPLASLIGSMHFWVAISMVFFVAATVFTLLKLCGDVGALGWWDLFINYGIAECFAFLVCTKWSNPVIHRNSRTREESSSSTSIRYLDWNSGLVVASEDQTQDRMCGLQDIGGHIMKIPLIGFQILLCMRLEGTPPGARNVPLPVLFSPIFLLEGAGVLFATSRLVEKIVLILRSEAGRGIYFVYSSRVRDCFGFLHHGSRLLGWWSIDETSREEQARLFHDGASGYWYNCTGIKVGLCELHWVVTYYNTFCGYPPEIVKKLPKKDLAEEVWRLQAALGEQTEITKFSQQEYERLQHVTILVLIWKKFFVEFALREKSALYFFLVGIGFYAATALINVRNAQFVECLLRNDCPYMMYSLCGLQFFIVDIDTDEVSNGQLSFDTTNASRRSGFRSLLLYCYNCAVFLPSLTCIYNIYIHSSKVRKMSVI